MPLTDLSGCSKARPQTNYRRKRPQPSRPVFLDHFKDEVLTHSQTTFCNCRSKQLDIADTHGCCTAGRSVLVLV